MTTSFGATLRAWAAATPDRPAVTCDGTSLSRAELVEQVQRVAGRMAELGVTEGSFVTISLPNSIEFVQAALAAWWLGAVPQPIFHRLSPRERAEIIELAEPSLVIGVPSDETGDSRPLMSIEDLPDAARTHAPYAGEPRISPVWKVVTSGGSTGRPKLIVATSPAYAEAITGLAGLLNVPSESCVLVPGPMTHNAPFVTAFASMLLGNHVVVMPRFDATEALHLIDTHKVAWTFLVPTMMHRIWRLPTDERLAHDVSSLDVVFHGGAACAPWLKKEWIDWLGTDRVFELYGGTELQAMTVITGKEWLDHTGSVGRPVIGEIECRAADGTVLPIGEIGELWMRRGPDQPQPYKYVGATARAAADGWESLGDLGYVDEDGYVYLTDRDTDMIVVGGANVYPAQIEAALDEYPGVGSSCVIGLPHEDLGNAPHAIVESAEPIDDDALIAFLRERLSPDKLPRSIERVTFPLRDEAGKVRRSALRAERLATSQ